MNDQLVSVTHNLLEALENLRYHDRERMLWIDALCIDQANNQEKGHQVGQMRLVYEYADNVLIWLGPSTPDVEYLMDRMTELDHKMLRHVDYKDRPLETWSQEWSDVKDGLDPQSCYTSSHISRVFWQLLERPWFKRVWVLQEAACARIATVVCGRHSVSSRTFAMMYDLVDGPSRIGYRLETQAKAVLDVMPGPRRRSSWYSHDRRLATLLDKFKYSSASVELDLVYALLGISSDVSDPDLFRPDYSISTEDDIKVHPKTVLAYRIMSERYPPSPEHCAKVFTQKFFKTLVSLRVEVDAIDAGGRARADG
ncbi:hypothetical protein PG995_005527 [Apiospora arundinis]